MIHFPSSTTFHIVYKDQHLDNDSSKSDVIISAVPFAEIPIERKSSCEAAFLIVFVI